MPINRQNSQKRIHAMAGWNGHPWIPKDPIKAYNTQAFTRFQAIALNNKSL
jgi:hypothetical protein